MLDTQISSISPLTMLAPPSVANMVTVPTDSMNVGQQMESLFVQLLIKQMRDMQGDEGMFPGDKTDTYGVMFDQFMADLISRSGGIGIANYIEQYVQQPVTPSAQSAFI